MKNNPRITKREQGLLKGALRRVFSRSELRRRVIDASAIEHSDSSRPRVKKWCKCAMCGKPEAKSYCAVDHLEPVIPVDSTFEEIGLDNAVNRLWCEEKSLQTICSPCHDKKSAEERKLRTINKRGKKNERQKP